MRLIDADAFKKVLSEHEMKHDKRRSFDDYACGAANAYEYASDLLDEMPTVERPHGEWKKCSLCSHRIVCMYAKENDFNGCGLYEEEKPHGEWISVSERLPEVKLGEKVVCIVWVHCNTWKKDKSMCMEWEHTTVRRKEVSRWLWNNSIKMDAWEVIAWMPLPKPYMKEGEAE